MDRIELSQLDETREVGKINHSKRSIKIHTYLNINLDYGIGNHLINQHEDFDATIRLKNDIRQIRDSSSQKITYMMPINNDQVEIKIRLLGGGMKKA